MRAVLESREKAALERVAELRAEFERVKAALVEAEEVLHHRVIGLEQCLEALAEQDASAPVESPGAPAGRAGCLGWDPAVAARAAEGARQLLRDMTLVTQANAGKTGVSRRASVGYRAGHVES